MSDQEPTAEELAEAETLARELERLDGRTLDASTAQLANLAPAPADALEVAALLRLMQPSAALTEERREALLEALQAAPQAQTGKGARAKRSKLRRIVRWSGVLSAAAVALLAVMRLRPEARPPVPAVVPAIRRVVPPSAASETAATPVPAAPAETLALERPAPAVSREQAASAHGHSHQRGLEPTTSARHARSGRLDAAEALPPGTSDPLAGLDARAQPAQRVPKLAAPGGDALRGLAVESAPNRPARDLSAADTQPESGPAGDSGRLDGALRAVRARALPSLAARSERDRLQWQTLSTEYAAVDRALARADFGAASQQLERVLARLTSQLPAVERRDYQCDVLARLAQVALSQGQSQAALQYAQRGLSLGTTRDVFTAQLLLARARAFEQRGATQAAAASYAQARAIANGLARRRQ